MLERTIIICSGFAFEDEMSDKILSFSFAFEVSTIIILDSCFNGVAVSDRITGRSLGFDSMEEAIIDSFSFTPSDNNTAACSLLFAAFDTTFSVELSALMSSFASKTDLTSDGTCLADILAIEEASVVGV